MIRDKLPLEVHDLTVSYQKRPVLYGIDLEIEEGSLVGILGPNGAGKSTLIKTIMNMIKPNGGYVRIFGKRPKDGIKRIGYIPQKESIDWDFPVTVFEGNIFIKSFKVISVIFRPGWVSPSSVLEHPGHLALHLVVNSTS